MHPHLTATQAQQRQAQGSVIGNAQPMRDQQRSSELHHELSRLAAAVTLLEDRVSGLLDRLNPVTLPSAPMVSSANCSTPADGSAGSLVGQAIQNVRWRMDALSAQMDSAVDRLAV